MKRNQEETFSDYERELLPCEIGMQLENKNNAWYTMRLPFSALPLRRFDIRQGTFLYTYRAGEGLFS